MWAEMKKSVSYTVTICFDRDANVRECQCECGAGQGPTAHCKHVATVLYALQQFNQDGDQFISEETCTQVKKRLRVTSSYNCFLVTVYYIGFFVLEVTVFPQTKTPQRFTCQNVLLKQEVHFRP